MAWSTRFATQRLISNIERGKKVLLEESQEIYQDAADEVADWWGDRIARSGRAPGYGMENVTARVTQPKRGGFFVRMGWLNNPPLAADGKTAWFVYQDVGYDLFGRGRVSIPGLMLQLDARQRLNAAMHEATVTIARRVEREIGRG